MVANTRAVEWLRERADAFDIDAKIVPVDSYDAGVQRLIDGTSDVLFGNSILLEAAKRSPGVREVICSIGVLPMNPSPWFLRAATRTLASPSTRN